MSFQRAVPAVPAMPPSQTPRGPQPGRRPGRAVVVLTLAMGSWWAGETDAQPVYRCGDGQYSQSPCPGGKALDVPPPPSAEQQRDARAAAEREARLADRLQQQRLASEQEAARRGPANVGPERKTAAQAAKAGAGAASAPGRKKDGHQSSRRDNGKAKAKDRVKREAAQEYRKGKAAGQGG